MIKFYRDGLEERIDAQPTVSKTREGHTVEKYSVDGVQKFFVTLAGTHWCAHGNTIAEAVTDAQWKNPELRPSRESLVKEIQAVGRERKITLNEFRLLTGACAEGCRVAMARAKVTADSMRAHDIRDKISREWGEKLIEILGDGFRD